MFPVLLYHFFIFPVIVFNNIGYVLQVFAWEKIQLALLELQPLLYRGKHTPT